MLSRALGEFPARPQELQGMHGVLRLRRAISFANVSASLRMTIDMDHLGG